MEIGPGHGALTEYMWDTPARYVAVELDRDLIAPLQARYSKLEVLNEDILALDLDQVLEPGQAWKIVGNLPYNISSPLILKFAEWVHTHPGRIADLHFMLQKEMAQRLAAQPGTKAWGRLSIATQLRFDMELLFDVPPESFAPPPKVNSSILRMMPKAEIAEFDADQLDQVVRTAFSARRKRLANALKNFAFDWDRLSLDPDMRADDVSVEQFLELARQVESSDDSDSP